jgi:hypothetical protein
MLKLVLDPSQIMLNQTLGENNPKINGSHEVKSKQTIFLIIHSLKVFPCLKHIYYTMFKKI